MHISAEEIKLRSESFYKEHNIELQTEREVCYFVIIMYCCYDNKHLLIINEVHLLNEAATELHVHLCSYVTGDSC